MPAARTMAYVRWLFLQRANAYIERLKGAVNVLEVLQELVEIWNKEHGDTVVSTDWFGGPEANTETTTQNLSQAMAEYPKEAVPSPAVVLSMYQIVTGGGEHKDPVLADGDPTMFPHGVSEPAEFPANKLGLGNGSFLIPKIDLFETGLPFFAGDRLEIAFDGEFIRCQSFTWSLDKLLLEIFNQEKQIWDIEVSGSLIVLSELRRSA